VRLDAVREIVTAAVSLLLTTGMVVPGTLPSEEMAGPVTGEATFSEAWYAGPSSVTSDEAALRAEGAVQATVESARATVSVYEWTNGRANATDPVTGAGAKGDIGGPQDVTRERYGDVTIHIEGDPDGVLRAWPNETLGSGQIGANISPEGTPSIDPSAKGVGLWTDDHRYAYEIDGPLFAVGENIEDYHRVEPEIGDLSTINATGELDLIVQEGTVIVGEGEDRRVFEADRRSTSTPTGRGELSERSYVAITVEASDLSMPTGSTSTALFLGHPSWTLNGTLAFEAEDGRMRTNGTNETFANASVEIEGRSVLDLTAEGKRDEPNETERLGDHRVMDEPVLPTPKVKAEYASDAEEVTVDGETVAVPADGSIPESVTFWGQILGLLALALSVGKKLVGILAGLVIRNPLNNDRRQAIYEYLRDHGLAHPRQIERAIGASTSSVIYHLRILEKHDLVISVDYRDYTVFFIANCGLQDDDRERLARLTASTRREIAESLVQHPGQSQASLAEALEIAQSSVSRHLAELRDAFLVEQEGSNPAEYHPSDLLERWLSKHTEG
jgi:predicted transcriptional regulator